MARYDKEAVKDAASGRWPEIISRLASVPESILDGGHHPCPKCGGNDRFNIDRNGSGSCFCNECKPRGTGNGIDSIIWLADINYKEALAKVAEAVGVKPDKRKGIDPAEHLDFMPWNQTLIGMWCLKKKPIKPAAIQAIGGRLARYQNQFTVVAIPVWGPALEKESPVGWIIYRADGGQLPKKIKGSDEVEWVKVKLTAGSRKGIIAKVVDGRVIIAGESGPVWKTEGPTDLLGLLSIDPSANAFTTANGAKEIPADWIIKSLESRQVFVVHDADTPGQDGATWVGETDGRKRPGWCPSLAKVCSDVRNVRLPFEISPDHGQDLRDYLNNGITDLSQLLEFTETAERFGQEEAAKATEWIDEAEDDPQRLARINVEKYKKEHSGRLVFWRDEWWKWREGKYRKIEASELKAKVWQAVRCEFERCYKERKKTGDDKPVRKVTRAIINNVIGAMESICTIPSSIVMPSWLPDRSERNYLAVQNGLLDMDQLFQGSEGCLRPVSDDWFCAFQLDYPFDLDADCPIWQRFIHSAMDGDHERIAILQEWAGYCLTGRNEYQRFLAMEGEGGNGKTVYTAGITAMLGSENISRVALEKFGGQFDLSTTIGKAVNICGDVGELDRAAEAELKQFTGGDVMQFDRKNKTPMTAKPTAKLILSWNLRPRFADRSDGLWRRMVLIPFNHKPAANEIVRGMDESKWWVENGQAPGILLWAIAGLRRLRDQGDFTRSAVVNAAMDDYRIGANPALEFLTEFVQYEDGGKISKIRLYELYQHFCQKTGHSRPLAHRAFGREVKKRFPLAIDSKVSIGNLRENAYEGIRFSSDYVFNLPVEKNESMF
jgi:P4 family phage/plasmid primase-like protien